MSDLTDLVPPLELCKLIPEDEFTDASGGLHGKDG